eukprot:scaffold4412_cov401-Prasinococcus_capsulatus_cf.AAC.17
MPYLLEFAGAATRPACPELSAVPLPVAALQLAELDSSLADGDTRVFGTPSHGRAWTTAHGIVRRSVRS